MIQYARTVAWDPDLRDLGTDSNGLVVNGLKVTAGAPAATAGRFESAAIIQNIFDGSVWVNSGSTAAPAWYLI